MPQSISINMVSGNPFLLGVTMRIDEKIDHAPLRAAEYPSMGDQLDMIVKCIRYLKTHSRVDIGPDGEALIKMVDKVKRSYPKD